ncbi:hypothetical protein [Corallincola spongiicola]|uniref:Uncharacterized protein n=1 Tax=Corallincola spongiicola TaxID=2520508 RepID=A0ABY1WLG0_9GAMM|nr:hypothetical protein [Corallincola spongiicola]TAA41736.1 hypothetical protein EXY25_15965 [Corallincola spongiicola]
MSHEYQITEFEFSKESDGFKEIDRFYSDSRNTIAIVGERPDGAFTFVLYQWDLTDAEYVGGGYWSCCELGGMFGAYSSAHSEAKQAILRYK